MLWAIRRSLRSYLFTSCSKAATSPFLLAWTRSRSSLVPVLTSNCAACAAIFVQSFLQNNRSVKPPTLAMKRQPFPWQCHLQVRVLLHHDLAGHLRMDRAVVGIGSRLGERVGERFVCIPHLGLEHSICADHRMRNVITVSPGHCGSDGYRNCRRSKTEIINLHLRVCRGGLGIRCDAR